MPQAKGKCIIESSSVQTRSQVSRKNSLHNTRANEVDEMNSCLPNIMDRPMSPSFRSVANITISPVPKQAKGEDEYSELEFDNLFLHTDSPLYSSKLNLSVGAHNSQYINNSFACQTISKGDNGTKARDNIGSLCTSFSDLAIHGSQQSRLSPRLSAIHETKSSATGASFSITSTPTQTTSNTPTDPTQLKQTKDEKIDKLLLLMENNSVEMTNLRLDLSASHANLRRINIDCNKRIDLFEDKLSTEVTKMHDRCDDIISQLESTIDSKVSEINPLISGLQTSMQVEIENKITALNRKLSSKVSQTEKSLDSKIEECNDSLLVSVKEVVKSYLVSEEGIKALSQVTNGLLEKLGFNLNPNSVLVDKMRETGKESLSELRSELTGLIDDLKSMQSNFSEELLSIKNSVKKFENEHADFTQVYTTSKEAQVVNKKIDKLAVWLDTLQQNLSVKSKLISKLDLKSRKLNLIFDGIVESSNEDICSFVGSLLTRFVPNFDDNSIETAFRLGKSYPADRSPRRVLVSFTTTTVRDVVLSCAGIIARAGPPGGKIYINEDIPEDLKRRRADVHKYVAYMSEKGYKIAQKGDSVVLNDTLYKYEDLTAMPKGMGLVDSRTVIKNGVVSFQSPHSPLSNLFPAPIKCNGITFQSAEHAFQHAKAVHCKDFVRAKTILNDPCPFEAMATGKRVEAKNDWASIQSN